MPDHKDEKTFSNVLEIVDYLKESGWKVSKSTVYKHVRGGSLRPEKDGKYLSSVVDRYAVSAGIRRLDGGSLLDKISESKQRVELRKAEAQADLLEEKRKIIQGKYVPKDALERELAQRAMIFKSDAEAFCRTQAGALVGLVGGDKEKVPDLVEYLLAAVAGWLSRYAADREFTVPDSAPAAEAILQDPDDDGEMDDMEE